MTRAFFSLSNMNDADHQFSSLRPCPMPLEARTLTTAIDLTADLPECFMLPKFQVGQMVQWALVPTQGFGKIIGFVYATGVSVEAVGYHYLIALDDTSPSRADGLADWAFEADLQLITLERLA
jgi:hypothetical protein